MIYEAYKDDTSVPFTTDDEAQAYIKGLSGWQVRPKDEQVAPAPVVKDWIGLTRALYAYVPLFQKSMRANPQGLNLFTTLLTEAKIIPDVSETAVKLAFQAMQIDLTAEEKTAINKIFADHNFQIVVV